MRPSAIHIEPPVSEDRSPLLLACKRECVRRVFNVRTKVALALLPTSSQALEVSLEVTLRPQRWRVKLQELYSLHYVICHRFTQCDELLRHNLAVQIGHCDSA